MNTMSGTQRAAMAQAKQGDWALADALELLHYLNTDGDVLCGLSDGKRLRQIVYCEVEHPDVGGPCEHCKATGLDADGKCENCSGRGFDIVDMSDWLDGVADDVLRIVDLNGDEVDLDDSFSETLTREWAEHVLRTHANSLLVRPQQLTLIPEAA